VLSAPFPAFYVENSLDAELPGVYDAYITKLNRIVILTEDRGQKTEDRGQKTEDRRQRTEDRGQKTEDRGQKTDDG
jgi:hypothetical protein